MKTDCQLCQDVLDELHNDARVQSSDIAAMVVDGMVTLAGTVQGFAERRAAVQAAERIGGVRNVVDRLFVRLPAEERRTDDDLAHAALDRLAWDTEVPDNTIKPRVQDRWLWLVGEADWQYQRLAAERAVETIAGVQGVTNVVRIRRRQPSPELKMRIEQALQRAASLHARAIGVVVNGTAVTMTGIVGSRGERMAAERAAWSAWGVTNVDNRIEIDAR